MVKKAHLEWFSPAGYGNVIEFQARVARWGRTSFDVTVEGSVEGRPVVAITLLYVSIAPRTHTPSPVPEAVRAVLGRQCEEEAVGLGAENTISSNKPV